MAGVRDALERERSVERDFVENARQAESAPKGWPAALIMFHVGMWRERLRDGLSGLSEGREYTRPPADIDELNDAELPGGIGTPLADAAARADHLLGEIIELYEKVGDRPFEWTTTKTTTEAVLRNSFTHPRLHMFAYYRENGFDERAVKLFEDAVDGMRAAGAPPVVLAAVLYNLAAVRVREGRSDEAIGLLREALPMRRDLKQAAGGDPDLAALRDDPKFQELVSP